MVTRNCATGCSRRSRVSDNRAALVGVIRHANVGWTSEAASWLEFKGADVGAVAGRSVGNARVIVRARLAALIKRGASRHARVDRGTAGCKRHRLGWAAIVRQRRQHRVGAGLVAGPGEARCIGSDAEKVMAIAGDGAVHIGSGSWGARGVTETVGSCVTSDDCVFQSHAGGANADAAASTFGRGARGLGNSRRVDTGVAGLGVVKAERTVLHIDGGPIVGNRAAIR